MRPIGLLIATVLLAILAGGVWWSNKKKAAEEAKPASSNTSPKILAIPDDQIAALSLKRKDGTETFLKKNAANKWELASAKPMRVDNDAVSSVTGALNPLNSDQVVEEKGSNFASFGLNAPSLQITVTKKDGKVQTLLIGDDTPTGGDVYAKLADDPRVFTFSSSSKSSLDKTAQDLKDKRLLTFDSDKLTRVALSAKKQEMEFGKNNQNEWQILQPKPMRADSFQVEELIRRLRDAKMDGDANDAGFKAGTPVATAKVTDNSGTQMLEIRKNKDDYFAKSSVSDAAYKVANDLGTGLDKSVDDFRNKKLFDFGFSDPSKIEVRRGANTSAYAKSGEKWFSGAKQIDAASLQSFIDKLRDLSASKFVETAPGAPDMEIAVTAKDGKLVEKAIFSKQLAKREGDPSVYELDQKNVDELVKALNGIKEAAPEKKK